jgi:phosphonate transport system ATP-binding protein
VHPEPPLQLDHLRCAAPDGRITLQVDHLSVQEGEHVAIIGPNGAGKSTLLRCISGFAQPVSGRVQVLGRELPPPARHAELRQLRQNVGQVLQGLHLVQRLTVLENVLIGALGRLQGWRSWVRWHQPQDVAEALRALDAVGLVGKAHERADRLSGGERQKVSLARMLMQRPRLILADEPTASLDPTAARDVCRLLRSSAAHATLITVVHNTDLLPLLADRVIGLRHGQPVFDLPLARVSAQLLETLYQADDAADGGADNPRAGSPAPDTQAPGPVRLAGC